MHLLRAEYPERWCGSTEVGNWTALAICSCMCFCHRNFKLLTAGDPWPPRQLSLAGESLLWGGMVHGGDGGVFVGRVGLEAK